MPRTCTICSHPKRAEIEAAIVAGSSYRHISSQFDVGYKSVERHASDHISQEIKQSKEAEEAAQSLDVVKQLKHINKIALDILKESHDLKAHELSLKAIDRVCKQIELQAKLLGDIDTPHVNIYVTPEWQTIRATIVQALLPYPDARLAVANALVKMEVASASLN